MYDVVIAGAGVIGAFIARELSRYELKICVLEKENDVAMGASKANTGIVHAGYDTVPGTLKALLNVRGTEMMEGVARELDVPYKKTGSLVVAFDEKDREVLQDLLDRGIANGVEGLKIIDGETIRKMEPWLSEKITHALYAPSAGIVCPYELTVAAFENAVVNGTELRRNYEVRDIAFEDGRFIVNPGSESITCRYFINAAGVCAGKLATFIGDNSISIKPRRGEYLLFDKSVGKVVSSVIFQCPTSLGKGVVVTSTVDGNTLIGPDAQDIDDAADTSTTRHGQEYVKRSALKAVPSLDFSRVIASFSGIRAKPATGDFIIGPSKANPYFINVAGIESPGLSCAPAFGEYVSGILKAQGLKMTPKKSFKGTRDKVVRFRDLDYGEIEKLIKEKPSYSRLVCRCEKVTEGEVLDCIRRPAGALDLDAVKRRTRAGMGRCQGGFCTPRIVELLARELNIPYDKVTKKGGKSWMLAGKTK
ncbi:MAG: NAD(P)/FAD-dependent oxidoreductase [Acetivibrionales bacterium]